jgi:hypothetical protein
MLGVDLNTTTLAADVGPSSGAEDAPQLGTQVFASNGRRYIYGQAAASISASTAVCLINTTNFTVAASGGSATSPAVSMATGDRGWFSVASV